MSSRTLLLIPLLAAVAACGPAVTITRDASLPIYPRTTYTWGAVSPKSMMYTRDHVNDGLWGS